MEPINPFPAEAVATYGNDIRASADDLRYMREALGQLNEYLTAYSTPDRRYGAAVGLRGGHGSGKTHLLAQLAASARRLQTLKAEVLYAKADKSNFYDIYSQLMGELPRQSLQNAIGHAMKNIALDQVKQAKATESLKERIKSPEDLARLYEEENLVRDQLLATLQDGLEKTHVPVDIPRALLQLDSPTLGDKTYQWLCGRDTAPPEELGLTRKLFEPQFLNTEAQDATAVNALESVGALLNLADAPLIILIDQLEVVFRVDDRERRQTLFSCIKKLTEQLGRQNALLFIAGTDDAWQNLPRDVTPRLRLGKPLQVGGLSDSETKKLLDSYTKVSKVQGFSAENAATIRQLSGGNPREILRIAYEAFKETGGELGRVDERTLIEGAKESGSTADRQRLVLSLADEVLGEFGQTLKDLEAADGARVDRLLLVDRVPLLALVTAKATDKLSEVDSARRVQRARAYVEQQWPTARLIVISVGYSSSEVESLLSRTSTVMEFDEEKFPHRLRTKAAEVVTEATSAQDGGARGSGSIEDVLNKIASRLDELEQNRTAEAGSVIEQFKEGARELARPEREEHELRTRWDMLDALDALEETLKEGLRQRWTEGPWREGRWRAEREQIKSILVSNEVNLFNPHVEALCGLYQDLLSEESSFWVALDRLGFAMSSEPAFDTRLPDFSSISFKERDRDPRWIYSRILRAREHLIQRMKRMLRGPSTLDKWLDRPLRASLAATGAVTFLWVLGWLLFALYTDKYDFNSYLEYYLAKYGIWSLVLTKFLPVTMVAFAVSYGGLLALRWSRNNSWREEIRQVKGLVRRYEERT